MASSSARLCRNSVLRACSRDGIVWLVNISSFHTHTRLCKHASGVPADYARRASIDGCTALGISDHCPYPDGTWAGSRMSVSDIPEYLDLVSRAKNEASFSLFWGFECEWHPAYESWYRDFLRAETGAEYLVYGSHWVCDNGDFWYIPERAEARLLRRYVDLTVAGLASGLYDFFAHPDLFLAGYTKMTQDVRAACRDIIDAAVAANLPLEVNGFGLEKPAVMGDNGMRSPYPVAEFWEMAAASGAVIICNSDAHRVEDVIEGCRNAHDFITALGITPVDAVDALPFAKKRKDASRMPRRG